jgi:hypothetical protein
VSDASSVLVNTVIAPPATAAPVAIEATTTLAFAAKRPQKHADAIARVSRVTKKPILVVLHEKPADYQPPTASFTDEEIAPHLPSSLILLPRFNRVGPGHCRVIEYLFTGKE